ncbi:hypothetical protein ACHAXR_008927 [Thalassiosira sp. AJA248-18]
MMDGLDWNDKHAVLAAVNRDGWVLQDASEELRGDRDVVLAAVKQNGMALKYASAELQGDNEIAYAANRQNGEAYEYVAEEARGSALLAESNNSNEALQYRPLVTAEIEDSYEGEGKWNGGALAADGCVYCAPYNNHFILKINTKTSQTDLVGQSLGGGLRKYVGAAASKDGKFIYLIPHSRSRVLKFHIGLEKWVKLTSSRFLESGKWCDPVLAADDCIYAAPFTGGHILKIDPSNHDRVEAVELKISSGGYATSVLSRDKKQIYFIPYDAKQILQFDIETKECKFVGKEYEGTCKWKGGVLSDGGCIYAMPDSFGQILKYTPSTDKTELVGDHYGDNVTKWSGCFKGAVGCIYGIPSCCGQILRFDPRKSSTFLIGKTYEDKYKWAGCVKAKDGSIFAIPHDHNHVLKISLAESNNLAQKRGITDAIDTPDLLGYDLYARTLAQQANSLQDANEPLCVGILAPWGSGKSFFWKLIKEEFEKYGAEEDVKTKSLQDVSITSHYKILQAIDKFSRCDIVTRPLYKIIWAIDKSSRSGYLYGCCITTRVRLLILFLFSPAWLIVWLILVLVGIEAKGRGKTTFAEVSGEEDNILDKFCLRKSWVGFIALCFRVFILIVTSPVWLCVLLFLVCRTTFNNVFIRAGGRSGRISMIFVGVLVLMPLWMLLVWINLVWTLTWVITGFRGETIFGKVSPDDEDVWNKFFCMNIDESKTFRHANSQSSRATENKTERDVEEGQGKVKYIFVEFGAWSYRGTDSLWASLMEEMWAAVELKFGADDVKWHRAGSKKAEEAPGKYKDAKDKKTRVEEAKDDIRWQFQKWKSIAIFALAVSVLVAVAVIIIALSDSSAKSTAAPMASNSTSSAQPTAAPTPSSLEEHVLNWVLGVILPLIPAVFGGIKASQAKKYVKTGYEEINKQMAQEQKASKASLKIFARQDFKKQKGFMGEVQKEVGFLIDYLRDKNVRLVIFVDDLDRCNQDTTMQILWAVKLLLCKGPISCWLAIDGKIVVDYIEEDSEVEISGFHYLEKIINVPFSLPEMDEISKGRFVEGMVDHSEMNAQQIYGKLVSLKGHTGNNILSEMKEDLKDVNEKLDELVKLAEKINEELGSNEFDTDELDISKLEEDVKTNHQFFSKLQNFALITHVTAYESFYNLMKKEVWIGRALRYSPEAHEQSGRLSELDDNLQPITLQSPKAHEDFETLRDKKWLEDKLHIFLKDLSDERFHFLAKMEGWDERAQIHAFIDPYLRGFDFAIKALRVYERMYDAVEKVQGAEADERNKDFRNKFYGWTESPQSEITEPTITTSGSPSTGSSSPPRDGSNLPSPSSILSSPSQSERRPVNRNMSMLVNNAPSPSNERKKKKDPFGPEMKAKGRRFNAKPPSDWNLKSYVYENSSMVDSEERMLLLKKAHFLSDVPRKIKRVMNVYSVSRQIAEESVSDNFPNKHLLREKLFILTVLQESFPYRMSWLVFMAMCAETKGKGSSSTSGWREFHSLLDELAMDEKTTTSNLPLTVVYARLVLRMLRCLPESNKWIRADTHTEHFETMLRGWKLSDLFSDQSVGGLRRLIFNLPRSMLIGIKQYRDYCVPVKEYRKSNYEYWTACPRNHPDCVAIDDTIFVPV